MIEYESLLQQGGLSLDRLATLCRVADAGGLSRAAGGDASRLTLYSRQLKELETFFGIQLTRRVGRTLKLTEDAIRLVTLARGQFRELAAFRDEAGASAPTLTIGASHSLLEWYLWPRLAKIRAQLPEAARLTFRTMRSQDLAQAVEQRQLDVALVRDDAVGRSLKSRPLFTMHYQLFVPEGFIPKDGRVTPKTLVGIPLAMPIGGQYRSLIEAAAHRAGVDLNLRLTCPSFTLAADAVKQGSHAAILPDLAEPAFADLPVRVLPLPLKGIPPRKVTIAWDPRNPESRVKPILAALINRDQR